MREGNTNHPTELVKAPGSLVIEAATGRVPELSPLEMQAAAAHFIVELNTLVEEALRYNQYSEVTRQHISDAADLVHNYFSGVMRAAQKQGENFHAPQLENFDEELLNALVVLFKELPDVRRLCMQSPEDRLYGADAHDFNPVYIAYQRAVRTLVQPPAGEDPDVRRTRAKYVKLLNELTTTFDTRGGNVRAFPLDVASVTFEDIQNSAGALLYVVQAELPYYQEARLRQDAGVIADFLQILADPNHSLSNHSGNGAAYAKVETIINTAHQTPPQLGLAEIPATVFEAAVRLRAFDRRFNLACLGHDTSRIAERGLVGYGNSDKANRHELTANPFNLASQISAARAREQSLSASIDELQRLEEWETLVSSGPTDVGGALVKSYESHANAGAQLVKTDQRAAQGALGKIWDKAAGGLTSLARRIGLKDKAVDKWDAQREERKKEIRRRLVEQRLAEWIIALEDCKKDFQVRALNEIIFKVNYSINAESQEDLLRPELMEAVAEALAAIADELDPAYADFWRHVHNQIVSTRTGGQVAAEARWTRFIFDNLPEARERLRELADNRFYYPDHIAGFREKKNYQSKDSLPVSGHDGAVIDSVVLSPNTIRNIHKDGAIVHWKKTNGKFEWQQSRGLFSGHRFSPVEAVRFLPPDGTKCWVYTEDKKLKLFELKRTPGFLSTLPGGELPPEEWVLIPHPVQTYDRYGTGGPVFSFDEEGGHVYRGDDCYDLKPAEKKKKEDKKKGDKIGHEISPTIYTEAAGPGFVIVSEYTTTVNSGSKSTVRSTSILADKEMLIETTPPADNFQYKALPQVVGSGDGKSVLINGAFYTREGDGFVEVRTAEFSENGPKGTMQVFQLLTDQRYLARQRFHGDDKTDRLIIGKVGSNTEIVVSDDTIMGPGLKPPYTARLQPDGSVLVIDNFGTVEIFDGEPVETESVEQRLAAVEEAIKVLAIHLLDVNESYAQWGTIGYARLDPTQPVGTPTVPNSPVANLQQKLAHQRDFFLKPTEHLNEDDYYAHKKELGALEESLKNALVAVYLADDARTELHVRQEAYGYVQNLINGSARLEKFDYTLVTNADVLLYAQQRDYVQNLNAFKQITTEVRQKIKSGTDKVKENYNGIVGDLDAVNAAQARVNSAFDEILNILVKEKESLNSLLNKAIHIDAVPLPPDTPLSAYVENGKLKPVVANALTANILAGQDVARQFGPEWMAQVYGQVASYKGEISAALQDLKKATQGTLIMPKTEPGKGSADEYLSVFDQFTQGDSTAVLSRYSKLKMTDARPTSS